eukprot:TRINITY_DN8171_c0_g1_i1.p1 TRINITY_DN8171_c0_g1~~TRINITY_DN8171_c0_g1_i1.p1  ORF type:complete len:572 (-),score=90.32 TRINITY_DN8171_c0_g1_i1:130-1755(-)
MYSIMLMHTRPTTIRSTLFKQISPLLNLRNPHQPKFNSNNFFMNASKRKADEQAKPESGSKKSKGVESKVNKGRIANFKPGTNKNQNNNGPVFYWMSRDQRINDNWALLYALEKGREFDQPVAVVFNLVDEFLGAGARQFGFMLRGLRELEPRFKEFNIQFFLLRGDPTKNIPELVKKCGAGSLVMDFSPLRLGVGWREEVCGKLDIPCELVDAHNIVPVWKCSEKREVGARTIRSKIHRGLKEYLTEFPEVQKAKEWSADLPKPERIDWDKILKEVIDKGKEVPEVTWIKPGEDEANKALHSFLNSKRLGLYHTKRNDPNVPEAQSNLSPYFHFGQLSTQRAALEASKHASAHKEAVEGFLEETIVRKELSDNYCFYAPDTYDSLDAAADWAKETLEIHASDKRQYVYSKEQLEKAKTHDDLWNAAQMQMVYMGKMHGYLRMYWAKKILEWTESPQQALDVCIYLNDKYELDGRDPSGYVGCMWSVAGIHDQGWKEREIFGKIRYMNYNGCKRKFDIPGYVGRIDREVMQVKQQLKKQQS